mmetsp:Transcript_35861/g.64038  ORF Transcript_35861/g.64038 Transcript_35861/m.64038 type:complete len:517 (-) Transcript_35861:586-2136(-)
MGCASSVQTSPSVPHTSSLQSSTRGVTLKAEFDSLSETARRKLADLRSFSARDFAENSRRPLSVVSFTILQRAAEELGHGLEHLPSLLGHLSRSSRKQGLGSQRHQLNVLQFLYCQQQPGGVLERAPPLQIIAITLCALALEVKHFRNVNRTRSALSAGPKRDLDKGRTMSRDASLSGGSISSIAGNNGSGRLVLYEPMTFSTFMLRSAYVRSFPEGKRAALLQLVKKLYSVTDTSKFQELLNGERLFPLLTLDDRDVFLLQTTLLVASNSHLFRRFDEHTAWCKKRVADLQRQVVCPNGDSVFAFDSPDSVRFAKSHYWVLQYIMVPFLEMWARITAAANTHDNNATTTAQELVRLALHRMAPYKIIVTSPLNVAVLNQDNKVPASSSSSITNQLLRCGTYPSNGAACRDGRKNTALKLSATFQRSHRSDAGLRFSPAPPEAVAMSSETTARKGDDGGYWQGPFSSSINRGLPCPLLDQNKSETEIPYDSVGMLSVCRMYNINGSPLILSRRFLF